METEQRIIAGLRKADFIASPGVGASCGPGDGEHRDVTAAGWWLGRLVKRRSSAGLSCRKNGRLETESATFPDLEKEVQAGQKAATMLAFLFTAQCSFLQCLICREFRSVRSWRFPLERSRCCWFPCLQPDLAGVKIKLLDPRVVYT